MPFHHYLLKFVLSVLFLLGTIYSVKAQEPGMAIVHVTAFTAPFTTPISDATILISKGKFIKLGSGKEIQVPKGYRIIDGKGKFATAGFWNSHVHFIESKWANAGRQSKDNLEGNLKDMLTSRGFVYVFDLAQLEFENLNHLRNRIKSGEIKGPTIYAVGVPFTSKSPFYIAPLTLPELKTQNDVRAHIEEQRTLGADGVKLWSASPTGKEIDYMASNLIREAAITTKRNKIPLFAHPTNLKGVEGAANHGVNVLAHVAADDRKVWDSTMMQTLVRNEVALIPTLKLHFWDLRLAGIAIETSELIHTAIAQLRDFNDAGGTVLFGTDVGYMADYDTKEEFVQMAAAGMTFDEILASLTTHPAKKFGRIKQTGTIERSKTADLVLLDEDPRKDETYFSKVVLTLHKGEVLFQKENSFMD